MATATPPDLTEEEWKKAVCALFTNVKLYNDQELYPTFEGIKHILADKKYTTPKTRLAPNAKGFCYYHPNLTVLYEMNDKGEIVGVFFNDGEEETHAEEKFLESLKKNPRPVHSIGLNNSPCTIERHECARKIVEKYEDTEDKPEIHFSQVYINKEKQTNDEEGIRLLIENGFELKVLDTDPIFRYLLDKAPKTLKGHLYKAYVEPRYQRDTSTRAFILNSTPVHVDDLADQAANLHDHSK